MKVGAKVVDVVVVVATVVVVDVVVDDSMEAVKELKHKWKAFKRVFKIKRR